MSNKEIKKIQREFKEMMEDDNNLLIMTHNKEQFNEYISKKEEQAIEHRNSSIEKEYAWMKWLIAISAGVFSVMTTQLAKGGFNPEQTLMIKTAISLNALGVIFGVVYLRQEIETEKEYANKINAHIQTIIMYGKRKYDKYIPSEGMPFIKIYRLLSLFSLLLALLIWVLFIWSIK